MKKAVIFDLDGTLWDSSEQVVPAWNTAFARHKDIKKRITVADIQSYMGKTIPHIAEIIFPELEEDYRLKLLDEACREEDDYLAENGAVLYPELENVLGLLSNEYKLYIVSNCQDGYIQSFFSYHKLDKYFSDTECSGCTGLTKGENIKLILERNKIGKAVYVGDTQGDLDSAIFAGVPFILADYGFGSINERRPIINSISELPDILKSLI